MPRVKKKDHENLTAANIERVISELRADSPISKKEACSMLNIAYNTTRLQNIIDDYEDREIDKGTQLNGYWVIREFVSTDEEAISILNQRYQWYCRVIERGLACLPSYTQGAVKFFLNALNNKKQMVGV